MELYKKYRPKKLSEVIGQEHAVNTLQSMLDKRQLPQSILFTGPSGCGKTTLARILANHKSLDCAELDLMEVNSSSYRGVDSIRDLARTIQLCPMGKSRVWILDEVHKLTSDAQHAFLKTLEDTPKNVYLLLCTTDPEKLIRPIKTRCTEIVCGKIQFELLCKLINSVAKSEGIKLGDYVDQVAEHADGSARAALVLLDKLRHVSTNVWGDVISAGAIESEAVINLCRALLQKKDWKRVAKIIKGIDEEPETVRWAVLGYAQQVLLSSSNTQAYNMIRSFSEPFYECKKAGLVASCYEVVCGS